MGGPVKTEEDALDPAPPREFRNSLAAIQHLEGAVAGSTALEGVVLRYGVFYGPGTGLFEGAFVDRLGRRRIPVIGDGGGWWSFLHVDDAAQATALAVERGAPGVYNIVDDEPAPVREWLPELARMLGAKPPFTESRTRDGSPGSDAKDEAIRRFRDCKPKTPEAWFEL